MKVQDLIDQLKKYDPNLDVEVSKEIDGSIRFLPIFRVVDCIDENNRLKSVNISVGA